MRRLGITFAACLVLACTYDASRLAPPDDSPADASRADSLAVNRGANGDVRDGGSDVLSVGSSKSDAVGPEANEAIEPASLAASVAFAHGRAQGAMSGYGYVSLGVLDSVTSPTCGGMPIGSLAPSEPPVTFNSTCWPNAITWASSSALCVSGQIPAWAPSPSYMDYLINWGILVGAATRDPVQGIGVSYRTVALTVTGGECSPLLAVVHLADDPSNLVYCASMTSGMPIRLSSFNTECYFGSGTALAPSDIPKIDRVAVQVPSRRTAVTLEDFCLTKIEFGK
jgi:hypothetical protein